MAMPNKASSCFVLCAGPCSGGILCQTAHAMLKSKHGNSTNNHKHITHQHGTRVILIWHMRYSYTWYNCDMAPTNTTHMTTKQTLCRRCFTGQDSTHRGKVWTKSASYQPYQPAARYGGPPEPPAAPRLSSHPFSALTCFQCSA